MTSQTTFYLSHINAGKIYDTLEKPFGRTGDLQISIFPVMANFNAWLMPKAIGNKFKISEKYRFVLFSFVNFLNNGRNSSPKYQELIDIHLYKSVNILLLAESILDKQIVDLNGRKLLRSENIRCANILVQSGCFITQNCPERRNGEKSY
jgi:hypothetical protein